MTKELFTETIIALRDQCDKDDKRAHDLSAIYGSDINPNDNSILTNVIFSHLHSVFVPEKDECLIEHFCFEQDFGRKTNRSIDDLWNDLILNMEVVDEIVLKKPYSRALTDGN